MILLLILLALYAALFLGWDVSRYDRERGVWAASLWLVGTVLLAVLVFLRLFPWWVALIFQFWLDQVVSNFKRIDGKEEVDSNF